MLLVLLLLFIIIPSTLLLLLIWLFTKKNIFAKIAAYIWFFLFGFVGLLCVVSFCTSKKELDKDDIYGDYVIDTDKCPGKQANWQYNHYRFKITEDNKIYFYITNKEQVIKIIPGTVEFNEQYRNPRIKLNFKEPKFHIIQDNPTLYTEIWSFYYVFHSEKFDNLFFTKGKWKSID